jgi:hypothetical protein
VYRDVEEDCAVAGHEIPVVLYLGAVTCHHSINTRSLELRFRFFDDRNQMLTSAIKVKKP